MAKVLTLDELRATPVARRHADGKDFVRTNRWVVFGHHFAAIAGPGPLVGPGARGPVRLPARAPLDPDRRGARRGRPRQRDPLLLGPAPRQVARPDGARRGRALRRPGRPRRHHRDHGHPARRPGARRRQRARRVSPGASSRSRRRCRSRVAMGLALRSGGHAPARCSAGSPPSGVVALARRGLGRAVRGRHPARGAPHASRARRSPGGSWATASSPPSCRSGCSSRRATT